MRWILETHTPVELALVDEACGVYQNTWFGETFRQYLIVVSRGEFEAKSAEFSKTYGITRHAA